MADLLNIGTSALLSLQRAINTTGHNIANVNTEGYSRQRTEFETIPPQLLGGNFIGSGVTIGGIERIYDQFLVSEVRNRSSSQSGFETYHALSSRLDNLLADPNVGLSPSIESFFKAMQDVANNPASLPERQVLLSQAQTLDSRFDYLDSTLRSLDAEVNSRLTGNVSEINSLAQNLSRLNDQIVRAQAAGGNALPNDLLDTRDQLLNQLSSKITTTVVAQQDGAVNVMIGNGQPLVVGVSANTLATFSDPFDPSRLSIGFSAGVTSGTDISRFLTGGELGGVLEFRSKVLDPARAQLGLIALNITESVNAQHQLGQDLNGQLGGDFFAPILPGASGASTNTGAATITVAIADVSQMNTSQYQMNYDGANWTLRNLSTQVTQTGVGPFTMDGLTFTASGAANAGDRFLINPTQQASTLFDVAIKDPQAIAAASPIRASVQLSNTGSLRVDSVAVADLSAQPLAGPFTLTFNPNALGVGVPGFDVAGIAGGPLAYNPATQSNGATFSLAGMSIAVSGVPNSGDVMTVEPNLNGTGDNRNALSLAALQIAKTMKGGTATFQNVYGSLVADVGVKTAQAASGAQAEAVLKDQAIGARDSVSGVNLDEEAADLIRYQQAYQAAAQMIAVADSLFQTLLDVTRR